VKSAGTYEVLAFYTSDVKLWVGPYAAIQNNSAPSVTVQLPARKSVSDAKALVIGCSRQRQVFCCT
jgi:hypothetical protein